LRRVLAIARNTLREVARERVALVLAIFGLGIVVASQALSPLALGEGRKVVVDFGLAGSTLVSILLAIVLGSSLLHKEIERKTVYAILAKPVRREEFLAGKFLGLWAATAALLLGMTAILLAVVALSYGAAPWGVLGAVSLSLLELGIVTAIVVLFSAFTTPVLTAFFALAAAAAGHFAEDLLYFVGRGAPGVAKAATEGVYWILPHLELYNARALAVHNLPIGGERMAFALCYGLLYIGAVLALAGTIFRHREFR